MATLDIGGRSVTVDDSFLSLSPDQQNATVDEIAKSLPNEFSWSRAVTDIPQEMKRTAQDHLDTIKNAWPDPENKSSLQSQLDSGKALLSGVMAVADIAIGAPVRSLAGHTLAN